MKNKALTGILLVVVGFIWYKVFFRVKDNLFGEGADVEIPQPQQVQFNAIQRDTFQIDLSYRDPFGETNRNRPVQTAQQNAPQPVVNNRLRQAKPVFQWPNIQYFGQVRRTTSKNPLGIVSIDGFKHHMRKGDQIYDGITVKSIGRDSIVIRYKKKTKTFWRD